MHSSQKTLKALWDDWNGYGEKGKRFYSERRDKGFDRSVENRSDSGKKRRSMSQGKN